MKADKRLLIALIAVQAVVGPLTVRDVAARPDNLVRGPKLLWQVWGGTNLAGAATYWLWGRRRT